MNSPFTITKNDIAYSTLALSLLIFLSLSILYSTFGISAVMRHLEIVEYVIFMLLIIAYIENTPHKSRKLTCLYYFLFALYLLFFLIIFIAAGRKVGMTATLAYALIKFIEFLFIYTLLYLPVVFFAFFGIYLIRLDQKKIGAFLLVIAFIVLLSYYLLFNVISYKGASDEIMLSYYGMNSVIHGENPYTTSHSVQFIKYATENAFTLTLTTNNTVVSTLDYPSLYIFASAPFYLLPVRGATVLSRLDTELGIEALIYAFIMILIIAIEMSKNKGPIRFNVFLIIFIGLAIYHITAAVTSLMIALILLSYFYLDKKYAFILLGLALALQEELWFSVLLLIFYSINNNGIRKGIYDALGAGAVFFILNSYFIIINPVAYFHSVFIPLHRLILPYVSAGFGYSILADYHVSLALFSKLFIIASLILLVLFTYTNRKEYVFFLSLIPFYFMSHSLPIYNFTFALPFIVTLSLNNQEKRRRGCIEAWFKRNRAAFLILIVSMLSVAIYLTYNSHAYYEREFSINVINQSVYVRGNTLLYHAEILYKNMGNYTVYPIIGSYSDYMMFLYGLYNYSILKSSLNCSNYCINPNRIILNKNLDSYNLSMEFNVSNYAQVEPCAELYLYSGEYFYASKAAYCTAVTT